MEYINGLSWSEMVNVIGDNNSEVINAKAGMISFPKSLLIRLMEGLSEQEVENLPKYIAKNDIKNMTLLLITILNYDGKQVIILSWI